MTNTDFARSQMAMSLAFHIVFAAVGVAMPLLMVLAEWMWLRTKEPEWLLLTKRWAKGTAVFFAVGAVSGTVLSFELGLLFPGFMRVAGPLVGMPFSLEGFAFFTEAIFLGIYLYGWDRVSPRLHLAAGVVVAVSGLLSASFVTLVNAWMNAPRGFRLVNGELLDVDPIAAMASPFAVHEVLHTALASYMAAALAVAGIHAWALHRGGPSTFHTRALQVALAVALPTSLLQPVVGHLAGTVVAQHQPLKLASMEQLETTTAGAPITIGPIKIPYLMSIMAFDDPHATVTGLDAFPEADRPNSIVRPAFLVMVGLGTLLAGHAFLTLLWWWRTKSLPTHLPSWNWCTILMGPSGILAMEAGWIVTEVGRQPWVIYGILRTKDAVTPMPGLIVPFATFSLVYLILGAVVILVLRSQVAETVAEGRP